MPIRAEGTPVCDREPGRYRNYLKVLAEIEMGRASLAPRLDPSDLVQETLMRAHRARDQFRGSDDESYLAWLRTILANTLATALRDHYRDRRDLRREVPFDRSLEHSSAQVVVVAAELSSPSAHASRAELLLRVAEALVALPEQQRQVFLFRHWENLGIHTIACKLGKTRPAIAGLLRRATVAMRVALQSEEW